MTTISKAFAYVVRVQAGVPQLLAMISDAQPGYEIVRGHQEAGETIEQAAIREVAEETGLTNVRLVRQLGFTTWNNEAQTFFLCEALDNLPDSFIHIGTGTGDDTGRPFAYVWLEITPSLNQQLVEGGNKFVAALIEATQP